MQQIQQQFNEMANTAMRIEPLNPENYDTWKLQMRAILIKNDLLAYVDGTKVRPAENAAVWIANDQKACADIMLCIIPSELGQIANCATSKEMWLKLQDAYQSKGPARKAALLKKVTLSRLKESENVRDHLNNFFDAVARLKEINVTIGMICLLSYSYTAYQNHSKRLDVL